MSEFDLINQYFKTPGILRDDVLLGIGDDCALLSPPPGKVLAVSTDTLISGVHFPVGTAAQDIGYKSLAVNLSDLAAMGAEPAWVSLAISLPDADEHWIEQFMQGFNELATKYNVALTGGDTSRGPLSITLHISGFVSEKTALRRNRAKAGDLIFITGTLGDAGAGLSALLGKQSVEHVPAHCIQRLNRPEPQIQAGLLLTRIPEVAAIDISDGLLADLKHICQASQTGAIIYLDKIPLSDALSEYYQRLPVRAQGGTPGEQIDWQSIISAGDDYELCFSCAAQSANEMLALFKSHRIPVTQIGEMTSSEKIEVFNAEGCLQTMQQTGYKHFNNEK